MLKDAALATLVFVAFTTTVAAIGMLLFAYPAITVAACLLALDWFATFAVVRSLNRKVAQSVERATADVPAITQIEA